MDSEDLARLVNNLKLSTDAKEKAVVLTKEEGERGRMRSERVVVGKIFSRKVVNREILKNTLPRILRSRGRTEIEIVGHNLFVVTFSLAADKKVALEEGPWHFYQDLMILKQTEAMQTPLEVEFDDITMWVQCHNVPIACMEPTVIHRIGEKIGKVEEVDTGEGGLCVGRYARVKVTRRIDQPLIRCVPVVDEWENNEVLVVLQYERLPEFCFICGQVGHISKDCIHGTTDKPTFQYDSWLRAGRPLGGNRTHVMRTRASSHRGDDENSSYGSEKAGEKEIEKGELVVRARGSDSLGVESGRESEGCLVSEMEGIEQGSKLTPQENKEVGHGSGDADRMGGEDSSKSTDGDGMEGSRAEMVLHINSTSTISPIKPKKNPKTKGWKRQARERKAGDVREGGSFAGTKRKGDDTRAQDREEPKTKLVRILDEEDEFNSPTAAAALQPRRAL